MYNTLSIRYEKFKIVFFASWIMKNIVVFSALNRFAIKLICCIAFRSASSACCLLKYKATIL